MMRDPLHTHHAGQALQLSELVNLRFSRAKYGTRQQRYIQMREPDGPSTDAGRKARQPLVLVTNHTDTGFVFGFVDLFKKTADIKVYSVLRTQYAQRYQGETLDLSNADYNRLVDDLRDFLRNHGIETRLLNRARAQSSIVAAVEAPPRPAPVRVAVPVGPIVLAMLFGFVLCYVLVVADILPKL